MYQMRKTISKAMTYVCGMPKTLSSMFSNHIDARGHKTAALQVDALESRAMMTVNVVNALPDLVIERNQPAQVVNLNGRYDNPDLNGTIARFNTTLGQINVLLYDQTGPGITRTTPITVTNFLQYITAGRYNDQIIHRSVPGFIIQGGGFSLPTAVGEAPAAITTFPQIQNEAGNSNIRGTIAMAKQANSVNSATGQWFFNLANNAGNLDNQNGGFTAFGRVVLGLNVMDALANVPTFNFGGAFTDLPLRNYENGQLDPTTPSNYLDIDITTIPEITYTVISSNSTLVTAAINGTNLNLSYGANASGSATVTVRATSADGTFTDDAFVVRINAAPVIGNLNPSAPNIGRNSPFTLSLGTATDDAGISKVDFYRDTNANNALDIGIDTLVGTDTSADGGWSVATDTNGLQLGTQRYFAVATDTNNVVSETITNTINIVNAAPVISAFTVTPNPAEGRVPITLNATAADSDGAVAFVRFYLDSNRNGVFDASTDTLIAEDNNSSDGFATVIDTTNTNFGESRYFAVATDSEGQVGATSSVVSVINSPFSVGSFTSSPETILRNQQLTLTASNIFIPAGKKVKSVEFYFDTNGNGNYDASDKRIGTSSLRNGVATLKTSTRGLPVGEVKYFTRVKDNLNEFSPATSTTVTILNNAPTVKSMRVSPTTVKNPTDPITLSISGSKDLDGKIVEVRYYRDTATGESATDGVLNTETDALLGTVTTPAGSFRLVIPSTDFAPGIGRVFAVAYDTNGAASNVVTNTFRKNAPPVIETLTATPLPGNATTAIFSLAASGVGDSDGTIRSVEFFLDFNGNSTLDARGDKSVGRGKLLGGIWFVDARLRNLTPGEYTLFARAQDNTGGYSAASSVRVVVA